MDRTTLAAIFFRSSETVDQIENRKTTVVPARDSLTKAGEKRLQERQEERMGNRPSSIRKLHWTKR